MGLVGVILLLFLLPALLLWTGSYWLDCRAAKDHQQKQKERQEATRRTRLAARTAVGPKPAKEQMAESTTLNQKKETSDA